jgi:hypothetical protein
MRKWLFLAALAVSISVALSAITFAQLRDIHQRGVFRDEIVGIGAPFPGGGDDQDEDDDEGDDCPANRTLVAKTGQTGCWDRDGSPIPCAGTGQDGEHQAGVSITPRFIDNLDGTVTDNQTSLIWLQNADCFGLRSWTDSLSDANTLAAGSCGLTDGSVADDWRLPNVKEFQSLFDYGNHSPALPLDHPFSEVQTDNYWTSISYANFLSDAWYVNLTYGFVNHFGKINNRHVWPVRGGP